MFVHPCDQCTPEHDGSLPQRERENLKIGGIEPDNQKSLYHCYNDGMKAHVWVMPKRTVLDPQGQTIQHALSGLGYKQVSDVRQGKFFVLNLDGWSRDEAQSQLERISKEVLTNPVIEEYRFEIVD
jgi:phosphoribosylformylglycinamidine synthase subunit PurS